MDGHSFTAGADYRVFATTMTGFKGGSTDALRNTVASHGTAVLEREGDEVAIGSPSNLAGTGLPGAGAYYVKTRPCKSASLPATIRPYDFFVRVLSGSPIPEMNRTMGSLRERRAPTARGGRVIGPATAKNDIFAITVNAEDTIGVIVGVDLGRGVPAWKVIAGSGVFSGSFIITL